MPPRTPHDRWSQAWFLVLGTLILWFLLLRFPFEGVPPLLDPTWTLLMALGFDQGIQAGTEQVFTYGPLGYLQIPNGPFVEETWWIKVLAECVVKAFIAFALIRFTLLLDNRWIRRAAFVSLILLSPWTHESAYFLAITAACLTAVAKPEDRLTGIVVAALIAPLGLAKFTLGAMGLGCVILVTFAKVFQGQRWRAFLPLLAFGVSTVVCWLWAGQSLHNLPLFVKGSLEISTGYNKSMLWLGIPRLITYALLALLLWASWIALAWWKGSRSGVRLARACLLLAPAILCWKAGFVRPDAGHVFTFFSVMALLPLWASILLPPLRGRAGMTSRSGRPSSPLDSLRDLNESPGAIRRTILAVLGLLILGLGWRGIHEAGRAERWSTRYLGDQIAKHAAISWRTLWQPGQYYESIQQDLQAKKITHQLPQIRRLIGKEAADEIPHTAAILYLNDIEIRHRPVFQSYSAYTPYLQTLNGEFFESERAPVFVLLKPEEIDFKIPLLADSQSYRVLLRRYLPIAFEKGWLLLKRRENHPTPKITARRQGTAVDSGTGAMNTWIPIPEGEGLGEMTIHLEASTYGRLLTLLYRPSILFMDVRRADGTLTSYRSPLPMMRLPFIIDPTVTSASAFLDLYGSRFVDKRLERSVAFRLRPSAQSDREFAGSFEWTFDRVPAPSADGISDKLRQEIAIGDFPPLPLPLVAMEPRWNFRYTKVDGQGLLMSHPVSRLVMEAPEGDHRFRAAFGIDAGAYAMGNRTDGVVFRVSQATKGGEPKLLFERHLDPIQAVGDRGTQHVDIPVSWKAPGLLILETLPYENTAWDWAWWSQMSLDPK